MSAKLHGIKDVNVSEKENKMCVDDKPISSKPSIFTLKTCIVGKHHIWTFGFHLINLPVIYYYHCFTAGFFFFFHFLSYRLFGWWYHILRLHWSTWNLAWWSPAWLMRNIRFASLGVCPFALVSGPWNRVGSKHFLGISSSTVLP